MDSSKLSALLIICMLFISTATPILGCGTCGKPHPKHRKPRQPRPIGLPPIVKPPVPLPPVTLPPVTVPPIKPPIDLPTLPPVTLPPVLPNPPSARKPCPCSYTPPPPAAATCPIDTLKLGACVDLLGGLVHIGLGDPVVNQCCPVLQGLVELEAAVCLCTTLKLKLLNLNIYLPLALQLLVTCGKTPPAGFTCTL